MGHPARAYPQYAWVVWLYLNDCERLTAIGYYPVIHHPITEYKAVAECLNMADEASDEVGQDYVITTFDMGVCMKVCPLI